MTTMGVEEGPFLVVEQREAAAVGLGEGVVRSGEGVC